jgi:hypothetical protein
VGPEHQVEIRKLPEKALPFLLGEAPPDAEDEGRVLVLEGLEPAQVPACLPGERGAGENPRAFLTPSWLRKSGSALVLVAGLYWFGQRAGWW